MLCYCVYSPEINIIFTNVRNVHTHYVPFDIKPSLGHTISCGFTDNHDVCYLILHVLGIFQYYDCVILYFTYELISTDPLSNVVSC